MTPDDWLVLVPWLLFAASVGVIAALAVRRRSPGSARPDEPRRPHDRHDLRAADHASPHDPDATGRDRAVPYHRGQASQDRVRRAFTFTPLLLRRGQGDRQRHDRAGKTG